MVDEKVIRKVERAVKAAGDIALARGLGVWEAMYFVGETLLDSPDPDIQAYLQWLDNQHRRDLN